MRTLLSTSAAEDVDRMTIIRSILKIMFHPAAYRSSRHIIKKLLSLNELVFNFYSSVGQNLNYGELEFFLQNLDKKSESENLNSNRCNVTGFIFRFLTSDIDTHLGTGRFL